MKMPLIKKEHIQNFLKSNWQIIAFLVLLGYFLVRTAYFALALHKGISPDELYHLGISDLYSKSLLIPSNNIDSFYYGVVTDVPYLFHLIMGKIAFLNFTKVPDYIILRFVNILLSLGTILFTYKLGKIIFKNKLVQIALVLVMTNTLMFTFLSSAVSYDNLVNLLAVLSIYQLVKFIKDKNAINLILLLLFISLGSLTKSAFLPLALILVLIAGFKILYKKTRPFFKNSLIEIKRFNGKQIAVSLITIFFLVLAGILYVGNLVSYKAPTPSCAQVLTHEQCLHNAIYKRGLDFAQNDMPAQNPVNPIRYIPAWAKRIEMRIFGIMGHRNMIKPFEEVTLYNILFGLSIVLLLVNIKKLYKDERFKTYIVIFVVALFYILVLMYLQNYPSYLKSGDPARALQGRYIFPVITPLYILFLFPFDRYLKRKILAGLLLITAAVFIYGDFVYFLLNVPTSWFG